VLSFGIDAWPRPAHAVYDFKPLIGAIVALFVARFVLGFTLTWATAVTAFVAGTAWGWAVDAWGVVIPSAMAIIGIAIALSRPRRRA
jgi:hypothetical protein